MKKSILTFAVFSLVVLTSFTTVSSGKDTGDDDDKGTPTTTTTTTTTTTNRTDSGGQIINDIKKKQDNLLPVTLNYSNSTSQNIDFREKSDL